MLDCTRAGDHLATSQPGDWSKLSELSIIQPILLQRMRAGVEYQCTGLCGLSKESPGSAGGQTYQGSWRTSGVCSGGARHSGDGREASACRHDTAAAPHL